MTRRCWQRWLIRAAASFGPAWNSCNSVLGVLSVNVCYSDEEYETDEEEEEGEEGAAEDGGGAAAAKPAAADDFDDDDDDMPDLASGQFFCEEIRAIGLPVGPGVPTEVCPRPPSTRRRCSCGAPCCGRKVSNARMIREPCCTCLLGIWRACHGTL